MDVAEIDQRLEIVGVERQDPLEATHCVIEATGCLIGERKSEHSGS